MTKGACESKRGLYIFFLTQFAQVCVAAHIGKGEVQSQQGISPACDPTQGGQDAPLVTQPNTEVS